MNAQNNHLKANKTIVFIVHNMYVWSALSEIYRLCCAHPNITTYVICANQKELAQTLTQRAYAEHTEAHLHSLNIPFYKIADNNPAALYGFLEQIKPDYIFRQSPWEADLPNIFDSELLAKYKLIYVPYMGLDLVQFELNGMNMEINMPFHLRCHRIYCTSEQMLKDEQAYHNGNPNKFIYLGNTKLEYIALHHQSANHFQQTGKVNILWAPHHSIDGWLNFATFTQNCFHFIRLAEKYQNQIHIKLRAHPVLIEKMRIRHPEMLQQFTQIWDDLENTSIDTHWDYLPSFDWSDLLITDGVSFLAEYPITQKPSIFIENNQHMAFNHNGLLARDCQYIAQNMGEVEQYFLRYLSEDLPFKQSEFLHFKNQMAFENAAKRIVENLMLS